MVEIEDIKKSLRYFTYDELVELNNNIVDEIRIKGGDKIAVSRFWGILINSFKKHLFGTDQNELLSILSEYTEQEFSKFRGVGKQVMRIAKHELNKNGLTFKN